MRVQKKEQQDGKIEMIVTATPDELAEPLQIAQQQLAVHSDIDLVTCGDLDQALAEAVDESFATSFIENSVMCALAPFAVTQEQLDIVMEPQTRSIGAPLSKGAEYTFAVTVTCKPEYQLSSYEPVELALPDTAMTEEEIDEQLRNMADSYATYEGEGGAAVKVVPEITDEWLAQNVPEVESLEHFRELLREQGNRAKTHKLEDMKPYLTVTELAKRFEGAIPDDLFEYTHNDMMRNVTAALMQQKMTMAEYLKQLDVDERQFSMQMMMQAREVIAQGLSLDALARHLKLEVTDHDIEQVLEAMAPGHAQDAREQYERSGRMYQVIENARRNKANDWLVKTARFVSA
ncbi:MAG: hypothetical protein LBD25_02150 [Coriobacteriales bacterium]|jgi:FKBP-type peptidyl-prolyl cis-trans isomerase (trigger factor)|nr:hypothetical protein [Coriobacteriales bacterium]